MPSKNDNREYIKSLAKRIVESSSYDKDTNTLFVTNPGISAELLKGLAKKQGFRVGALKSGEYISIPLNYRQKDLDDQYVSQFDNFLDTYTNFNKNYHTLLTAYKTFDLMEENLGEVDLILSTYVEEVLSAGFVDDPLKIKISNPDAQKIVDAVLYKNKFFARLPMIVRNIAKYGNMGFTLSYPYLMTQYDEVDADIEERKIDVVKDLVITPVNPKFFKVTCDNWYNVINYQTQIDNTYSYTNNLVSVQNLTWQPWQFCFTGDTKISLLDGRELSLLEIQKEFGDGEFWVYSCREDGRIVPGKAYGLRKTRENAELVEVELDNGEKIHCTPDHKFLLRTGEYCEAKDLQAGVSLMPLYRKIANSDRNRRGYEQHFDNAAQKWLYTHYKVAQEIHGSKRDEKGCFTKSWHIHHKDFNSLNNSPDNLQWLTCAEHNKLHNDIVKDPVLDANRRKASSEALKRTWRENYDYMCFCAKQTRENSMNERLLKTGSKVTEKMREASRRNGKIVGKLNKKRLAEEQKKALYNHKVVAVRSYKSEDVYDFTVDKYHNFALSAGVFVHNCHFLIYSETTEPYGQSMLWSMRSSFDQLTTLEALLAVSRASKVQRLVISIPIPVGASQMDAYQYLNEFKANYLSSLFTDAPGTKAGRKIPGATSIFVKPAIKDFTIDKIDSNIDLSSTEDVEYFLDKILRNSKLPKGYLVGDDTITTAQTLESQDLKLSRALVPLKKALVDGTLGLVEKILTHAGFDVSKINVEVTLNKPIQISNDLITKYNDIIQLIGNVQEVINPNMTNINRYQLLVEMGIPVNAARLMCSKSSISVLQNAADLKKFMLGQKEQEPQSTEQIPDAGSMEECTKVDMISTSKQFLKENVDLAEDLNDFYKVIKAENKSGKKSLHESLIKPQTTKEEKKEE